MRDDDQAPFAEDEVGFLHELAPALGRLLRSSLARTGPAASDARTEGAPPPPATLILDAQLRPSSWTAAAADWLAELNGEHAATLPAPVYELGARALTPAAEATALPASVRLQTAAGRWAVLEGAPLEGAGHGQAAITFRAAGADEVFDLLAKTYDLTRRERQLVALVLDGLATKQLAVALSISPHTVQDHLKAVFAKTCVRSRGELVSRLAGRTPASGHDDEARRRLDA